MVHFRFVRSMAYAAMGMSKTMKMMDTTVNIRLFSIALGKSVSVSKYLKLSRYKPEGKAMASRRISPLDLNADIRLK
ncbi:hypothetical protein D3C75_1265890 [compost metagenome]